MFPSQGGCKIEIRKATWKSNWKRQNGIWKQNSTLVTSWFYTDNATCPDLTSLLSSGKYSSDGDYMKGKDASDLGNTEATV